MVIRAVAYIEGIRKSNTVVRISLQRSKHSTTYAPEGFRTNTYEIQTSIQTKGVYYNMTLRKVLVRYASTVQLSQLSTDKCQGQD